MSISLPQPPVVRVLQTASLCALREHCGESPTANFGQRFDPAGSSKQFQYYLLTNSFDYGNVHPVIALAQRKFLIAGHQVTPSHSRNGIPVSTANLPTAKINSANSPTSRSLRTASLRTARPQLPWNHILTQPSAGRGVEPPNSIRRRATNAIKRAPLLRPRKLFTDYGTRITEHIR
jgi:hypothetical protein